AGLSSEGGARRITRAVSPTFRGADQQPMNSGAGRWVRPGGTGTVVHVTFGVLGAVTAWDETGEPLGLRGPKHRAVLARLVVARRRVVPVARLVEDLWEEPPE